MKFFRLTRLKYSAKLSGYGASLFGNRWNSKGVEIVYTSESRALAMAEIMVHTTLANLPSDFVMIEIYVPDTIKIGLIKQDDLKEGWHTFPFNYSTQQMGDQFISNNAYAILKVPSAVVKGDHNYLINPRHEEFQQIKIKNTVHFPFDHRIFN